MTSYNEKKKMKSWCNALVAALALSACLCGSAHACRFLENVELRLPFNTTALSREDRRVIANAVSRAKRWPDVQIQAIVIAGAYIGERDLDDLQERRGENVQAYLRKLGIKSKNIYIEPKTLTDVFAHKLSDGTIRVQQIEIELSPICKEGSCEWMCDDPRLWPPGTPIDP
ncbi:hypothetical protein [Paraburkholderia susongensis]|uniref:OmpA family protein n=1 Tax=Paraburkholderia susongensis TaxID=1515439 RepID=A0A1X7LSE7_9BURK|nr:hypothetical protein [Paraburkholderia susongensis]SMG56253.1 hypothetical protein SAMN06265784_108111 [Paraburkholderia susongensis]